MERSNDLQPIFERYLRQECTPEEVLILLRYFGLNRDGGELKDRIMAQLESPIEETLESELQTKAMYEKVHHRLHAVIAQGRLHAVGFEPKRIRIWWAAIAASAALFAVGYFARVQLLNWVDPVKQVQVTALPGERKILTLTDGTKIWISPATTMVYPDHFRGDNREVRISGEAYFEVAHDVKHPFIVHTAQLDTRVLGTSFDVQAYTEQADVKVTLLTGKVRVTSPGHKGVDILPKEQAVLDRRAGTLTKSGYPDAETFLDRREGILKYRNTPLPTVIADLQRAFNIVIKLDNRMRNCAYVGSFRPTEKVQVVMQKLVLPFGAKLRQDGARSFIITGRACK